MAPGKNRLSAAEIVYRGLLKLEYRGYDSAGLASINSSRKEIVVLKGVGRINTLEKKLGLSKTPGYTIIGHTRWATHGRPSDANAHPHTDCRNTIAVVHNGIIQNYLELKNWLKKRGHVFRSETDTEVFAHLVEELYMKTRDFYTAFKKAVEMIKGSYAIAAITIHDPEKIYFARKDSPLIIGVGENYNLVASDIPALLEYTRKIIVVHDNEVGYITPNSIYIEDNRRKKTIDPRSRIRVVEWSMKDAGKSGYPHYMLKEIHEQPRAIKDTIYGVEEDPMIDEAVELLSRADNIYVTAAGTSYYASLYYSMLTSIIARKPVIPFIASEYTVYHSSATGNDVLIVISQSGETIDSLMALRAFKKSGARIIAVSNVVDSAIPRESDIALYTRAGPEIGVAATKTFTTQTILLAWLTVKHGVKEKSIDRDEGRHLINEIKKAPELVAKTIAWNEDRARKLSRWLSRKQSMYYLSRGIGVPVALEGALKMKEIAYIHAEGYPAGESKHGPIALVEEDYPVVFTIPDDKKLSHLLHSNIKEMKARGASTIVLAPESLDIERESIDYLFKIPPGHWIITAVTHTPPLQLLAYYTAVERGYDPDRPRNLAKTVTVE